jgi:hypothetical protein
MTTLNLLYSQNPSEVKIFFKIFDNISKHLKLDNYDFLVLTDNNGNTLLHNLVLNYDYATIHSLLNSIKDLDQKSKSKILDAQNNKGNTPLHLAAELSSTTSKDSDNQKLANTIASLLDTHGSKKNIANKGGHTVSLEDKSVEQAPILTKLFGGLSRALELMTTEVSIDKKSPKVNNYSNLSNFSSDVSIDNNLQTNNFMNLPTEVSVEKNLYLDNDKSGGSENSISDNFEATGGSSEETKSGGSSDEVKSKVSKGSRSFASVVSSQMSSETKSSSSNSVNMRGGAASEGSMASNTSSFVKSLLTQFNSMKGGNMSGGGGRTMGQRRLPSLIDYDYNENEMYGGRDFGLSREQMKESSLLHDQVVKIFIDEGDSEEEARVKKMALYKYTKDMHPELNNLDRARKMRDYANDKSILKNLDLESSKKIYSEVKSKQKNTESTEKNTSEMNTSEIETTEEKPKKKTSKKTTKEPKEKKTKKTSKK